MINYKIKFFLILLDEALIQECTVKNNAKDIYTLMFTILEAVF